MSRKKGKVILLPNETKVFTIKLTSKSELAPHVLSNLITFEALAQSSKEEMFINGRRKFDLALSLSNFAQVNSDNADDISTYSTMKGTESINVMEINLPGNYKYFAFIFIS